ncbi:unnamed protein product [Brassica napus]|uniref:(rape) hypothetical protein n=1 Tax=Brassica napus TaxID=3708 RepID=A0A816SRL4_BRANA|nr:unnamed protein product [Brassica napus]
MIGRADIQGSKSNVAYERLAATSQLSPVVTFSDTSSFKFKLAVRRRESSRKSHSQSVPGRHEAVRLATLAAQAARQQSTGSELGPRAQPSEPILFQVLDPFCRLHLPTLLHRSEAVHLRDLMRL